MKEKGFYAILFQALSFLRINVSLHSSHPASVQTSPFVPVSLSIATFGRTTSSGDYQLTYCTCLFRELKFIFILSEEIYGTGKILKFKFQSFFSTCSERFVDIFKSYTMRRKRQEIVSSRSFASYDHLRKIRR